jgi:hypothetical protein
VVVLSLFKKKKRLILLFSPRPVVALLLFLGTIQIFQSIIPRFDSMHARYHCTFAPEFKVQRFPGKRHRRTDSVDACFLDQLGAIDSRSEKVHGVVELSHDLNMETMPSSSLWMEKKGKYRLSVRFPSHGTRSTHACLSIHSDS